VKTLQTGINYTSICLEEASKIAVSENKKLDEKHWNLAAERLGIF